MATVQHPRSAYKQVVSHLRPDSYGGTGRRAFFDYRDLGIEAATGGDFDVHAVRAKEGEHVTTGWHYHTGTIQVVYCLNGWEELAFEDGSTVRLLPGSCVNIPPGCVHNEVAYSDDMEVLVFSSPAKLGTVPADSPLSS